MGYQEGDQTPFEIYKRFDRLCRTFLIKKGGEEIVEGGGYPRVGILNKGGIKVLSKLCDLLV